MKFFIDTANLAQIKEAQSLGVLDGVTTNPSLMAKEGITGEENVINHYKAICEITDGDVSAEVISTTFEEMIAAVKAAVVNAQPGEWIVGGIRGPDDRALAMAKFLGLFDRYSVKHGLLEPGVFWLSIGLDLVHHITEVKTALQQPTAHQAHHVTAACKRHTKISENPQLCRSTTAFCQIIIDVQLCAQQNVLYVQRALLCKWSVDSKGFARRTAPVIDGLFSVPLQVAPRSVAPHYC